MLIAFVALYLVVTVAVGLWAARRVHNTKDYVVAGRSLPLYMSTATVFATWFGAETVLGVSATFLKDGLRRHRGRPLRLLLLPGVRRAVLRPRLLPHGPADHRRLLPASATTSRWRWSTSVCDHASYLGWTSAQFTALGAGLPHALRRRDHRCPGASSSARAMVLLYTLSGAACGRWRITDLSAVRDHHRRPDLRRLAGRRHGGRRPAKRGRAHAAEAGKFEFWPKRGTKDMAGLPGRVARRSPSARSRSRTYSSASPLRRTRHRGARRA